MNRCLRFTFAPAPMWRAAVLMSLLAVSGAVGAQEAIRAFPAAAKRANLQVTYPPDILLNGQAARLSPGARIRNTNNMLVVSGSLAGQTVAVNYLRDPQGLVHEVWILNAAEVQQPREGASLPPNYVTDAGTGSGEAGTSSAAASPTPQ